MNVAESEAMTCINVRIPTPTFKLHGHLIQAEGSEEEEAVSTHRKANSQGDNREIAAKMRKIGPISTDLQAKSLTNVQISS